MNREGEILAREFSTVVDVVKNLSQQDREYMDTLDDAEKKAYLLGKYRAAREEKKTGQLIIILIIISIVLFLFKVCTA
jgi:t-SNARE complex subunit (syntaxin)